MKDEWFIHDARGGAFAAPTPVIPLVVRRVGHSTAVYECVSLS